MAAKRMAQIIRVRAVMAFGCFAVTWLSVRPTLLCAACRLVHGVGGS